MKTKHHFNKSTFRIEFRPIHTQNFQFIKVNAKDRFRHKTSFGILWKAISLVITDLRTLLTISITFIIQTMYTSQKMNILATFNKIDTNGENFPFVSINKNFINCC